MWIYLTNQHATALYVQRVFQPVGQMMVLCAFFSYLLVYFLFHQGKYFLEDPTGAVEIDLSQTVSSFAVIFALVLTRATRPLVLVLSTFLSMRTLLQDAFSFPELIHWLRVSLVACSRKAVLSWLRGRTPTVSLRFKPWASHL